MTCKSQASTALICLLLASVSGMAAAHGGDKPGPHGGYLVMPGAFHTELVLEENIARVYLVDIEFKNPVTANSSVAAVLEQDGKSTPLTCSVKSEAFECVGPKPTSFASGILHLQATRAGLAGVDAVYALPLKPFPTESKTADKVPAVGQAPAPAHH